MIKEVWPMIYSEAEAREAVIEAGHRLREAGLVARTWGNISARISEDQFVITPSGLAYETMRPEDLVIVNIQDGSHQGSRKPSSEKGIHADAYRLRPDIHFVIHTHQSAATVFGIGGMDLTKDLPDILGDCVPCAAYGLPSTKTLRKAVAKEVEMHPESKAFFMKNHGALCLGTDETEAFKVSAALEEACGKQLAFLDKRIRAASGGRAKDFGKSVRSGHRFLLTWKGMKKIYDLKRLPKDMPEAAAIHAAIYKKYDVTCIYHEKSREVRAWSRQARTLRPYVDDLAQIGGVCIGCVSGMVRDEIVDGLNNCNAVCLFGNGALCTGKTRDDTLAVAMILRKGALSALYAKTLSDCEPISKPDARLQRMIYLHTYSRKKEDSGVCLKS